MRKLWCLVLILLLVGCATGGSAQGSIKGYWVKVAQEREGQIQDLSADLNAYLEITDEKMIFYNYYSDTETYGFSTKYYKLDGDMIYHNIDPLTGNDWKSNLGDYGGVFKFEVEDQQLQLITELSNGIIEKDIYRVVELKDWPIKE
jgi:hypothetical protein